MTGQLSSYEPPSWADRLADLDAQGLRRALRTLHSAQGPHVMVDGRRLCNFASNDYLNLANDARVRSAATRAVEQWGWGAGASRLVAGHMAPHEELEARLAAFMGTRAALVCSTGYQANLAVLRALAGPGDVILLDKLDHASIIDGAFASAAAPGGGPIIRTFPHKNYQKLQRLLKHYAASARRRIIVSDSIFSMDGDFADVSVLVELKHAYGGLLCLDEAHSIGVFGPQGEGLAHHLGLGSHVDVIVGTLSKAFGGFGGFVAGSREIVDLLVNVSRSFIYTTALPPAACAAAIAALDIVQQEPALRTGLLSSAEWLRRELGERLGLDIGASCSHIVPVIVGPAEQAVALARLLESQGIMAAAIRPPTVAAGKARIRLSVTAGHSDADLGRLVSALRSFKCMI